MTVEDFISAKYGKYQLCFVLDGVLYFTDSHATISRDGWDITPYQMGAEAPEPGGAEDVIMVATEPGTFEEVILPIRSVNTIRERNGAWLESGFGVMVRDGTYLTDFIATCNRHNVRLMYEPRCLEVVMRVES